MNQRQFSLVWMILGEALLMLFASVGLLVLIFPSGYTPQGEALALFVCVVSTGGAIGGLFKHWTRGLLAGAALGVVAVIVFSGASAG